MNKEYEPSILVSRDDILPENTKRIYFVRHGHSGGTNVVTSMNPPLTSKGVKQAESLKDFFTDKPIDAVITSNLSRAKETANIIIGDRSIEKRATSELNELHCIGNWEALSEDELTRVVNSRIYKFNDKVENGETLANFHKRIERAWNEIIAKTEANNILLVTHYEVMRVLISILFKVKPETNIDFLIPFPHASVSEIRIVNTIKDKDLPDKMYVLQYLCKTEHLSGDLISY